VGPILERTIHARTRSIDLDLRLGAPLQAAVGRRLHEEVRAHRTQPVPGTLGPVELDAQGRALRLSFPSFDLRTTRLDSVLAQVRAQPILVAGILARAQVLGRRLTEAGRSPDVGDPAALLIHPEGRMAVLGVGLPELRTLLLPGASSDPEVDAQLRRLAAVLGGTAELPAPPKAAAFGEAWRAAVGDAGLRGPDVLSGPLPSAGGRAAQGPLAPARPTPAEPLRLALPDAPRSRPTPAAAAPPQAKPTPPGPRGSEERQPLSSPRLAALAAASPEAQMAALRASERPLPTPPQGVWVALALGLIATAFVILFRTHQSTQPEARELAPPAPRPLRGPGFQPKPPSAIGRPPGAVPPAAVAPVPPTGEPPRAERGSRAEAQLPSRADLISVVSKPSGATVRVDGELLGKTPLVLKRALQDRGYMIELDMPGYAPWSKRLRPDPTSGALSAIVELQPD